MSEGKGNTGCVVDNHADSSRTCTGRIVRTLTTIASFSLAFSLSSAIASSGVYLLDRRLEAECSTVALLAFSITTSTIGMVSCISAMGISSRLCGNCDVYGSSVSPLSVVVVPNPRGVIPNPLSPYNISSSISPQCSSANPGSLSAYYADSSSSLTHSSLNSDNPPSCSIIPMLPLLKPISSNYLARKETSL